MKKGEISVRSAASMAFDDMKPIFTIRTFINRVRSITLPYYPLDGNIQRRLRELRADDPKRFGYEYKIKDGYGYYEKSAKN